MNEFFEEERHRCEVRQILKWRVQDRNKALEYITDVRKKRGDVAADQLHKDAVHQWNNGNRGIHGDWK